MCAWNRTDEEREREKEKKLHAALAGKDLSFNHPHITAVGVATTVQQIYH